VGGRGGSAWRTSWWRLLTKLTAARRARPGVRVPLRTGRPASRRPPACRVQRPSSVQRGAVATVRRTAAPRSGLETGESHQRLVGHDLKRSLLVRGPSRQDADAYTARTSTPTWRRNTLTDVPPLGGPAAKHLYIDGCEPCGGCIAVGRVPQISGGKWDRQWPPSPPARATSSWEAASVACPDRIRREQRGRAAGFNFQTSPRFA